VHVVPHLVMRSNLDLFLKRLPVDVEATDDPVAADRGAVRVASASSKSGKRGRIAGSAATGPPGARADLPASADRSHRSRNAASDL
jgi:hypothetical protein